MRRLLDYLALGSAERRSYLLANGDAIHRALEGIDPYGGESVREGGARMVVNISCAHIPALCEASRNGDRRPYKNYYDLERHVVGDDRSVKMREQVDRCLPVRKYKRVTFAAVELNGTGIRFYGDYCLVLMETPNDDDTVILDRNSFDMTQPPLARRFYAATKGPQKAKRRRLAASLAGTWTEALTPIATMKILGAVPSSRRRLTTGQISGGLLDDEDYVEALRPGSFGTDELAEARTSNADAALEQRTGSRLRNGPPPALGELLWLLRRRSAERALRRAGVRVRVASTRGRVR